VKPILNESLSILAQGVDMYSLAQLGLESKATVRCLEKK